MFMTKKLVKTAALQCGLFEPAYNRREITFPSYSSPRFFKKAKGILLLPPSVCLSVRPLCYLLLYHWTKFNQIWCVSYSNEWGTQRNFFWPHPLGPGEGSKGQISFNFNYKVNFKDFYSKLCVCSHK